MNESQEYRVQEELKQLSSKLQDLDKTEFFRVPENYFSKLQDLVIYKIEDREQKNQSSSVPGDYFDQLQNTVLQKIADNETEGIPEQVLQERHVNPFRAPDGYFEKAKSKIYEAILPKKGRVIKMRMSRIISIAASITGLIALVWILNDQPNPGTSDGLANISSSEVIQYMEDNIDEFDFAQIEKLAGEEQLGDFESLEINSEDIENYLQEEMDDLNIEELL